MALRNSPEASAPAFESEDDNTTVLDAAPASAPAAPKGKPAQDTAESRALLVPKSNALSAFQSVRTQISELQNSIPVDTLETMGLNVFPRITFGEGSISMNDEDIGKKFKMEIVSWNFVWLIVTGEQSSPAVNKLIRTSYDGVNLKDHNDTIDGYIAELKSNKYNEGAGYSKANAKRYIELYGPVLGMMKCTDPKKDTWAWEDLPADEQKLVQVSLSPQSVSQWQGFEVESKFRKSRGQADTAIVYLTHERKVINATKFGIAKFSAT